MAGGFLERRRADRCQGSASTSVIQPRATAPEAKLLASTPAVGADLAALTDERPEQRVPMSRLRQRVAERLLLSQQTNAILTTFNEINMKPVMDFQGEIP